MARIIGAHAIIYSKKPEADRAFLRDVIGFRSVDVGEGWLIFALPPAEVAIHPQPADHDDGHELYLMVDDVEQFVSAMAARGVACTAARDLRWGVLTDVTLPGGGKLGVYQPRHARPPLPKQQSRPRRQAARKTKSASAARRRTRG
jgi:hypothetical protein